MMFFSYTSNFQTVIIKEDSPVYEYWQDPPVPIYLKVYMFNVSNPAEFLNGEKPALVQTGPYTYRYMFLVTERLV